MPTNHFRKNHIPWNKGKEGYKRKPRTEEVKKRISLSLMGEKHFNWKGGSVGYSALHKWVKSRLGNIKHCAYCQSNVAKRYEWANISHSYKRELSDWIRLCCKCHQSYDKGKITL